ncbi:ABC transporter ATP-binding protein [Phaeobacter porticola]|uniref:ATPase component of various ABC-type transport system n=1 Tax=Phaeobacter porticola TaxID=1844006 RepID=A0A1L3IAA7_9RHOB|nr:ATP-binding cassette domain-containing protein [Phaeobacter porticola]APG48992.1 ATPase component of various ABC-type transport system [Phaeobacter porticola]
MIRVDDLCLFHSGRPLLQNISFNILQGQTLALIGASGSGKTSLARLLLGVLPGRPYDAQEASPQGARGFRWSGQVRVLGVDMLYGSTADRRKLRGDGVGLVVQALADALNPHQTVLQHILELLPRASNRQEHAKTLCAQFNIPDWLLHRYPSGLSGGEIQRVLTALAMARDPRVLILDEPTAALDRVNRTRAIALLEKGRLQRCQLLITHDLDLACQMADQMAILHEGKLVEDGPAIDMLRTPTIEEPGKALQAGRRHRRCLDNHGVAPLVPSPRPPQVNPSGLILRDISLRRGDRLLLNGVSTVLPRGECLAVLGPSGCGKSTLARLLVGYDPMQAGNISWRERPGDAPVPCYPHDLALVPQHPHRAIARHMTVAEVLEDARRLNRLAGRHRNTDRAVSLLEKVGLPQVRSFLDQRAADLSGGQAQRLVIARALSSQPRCLIADEPTASLDRAARNQVLQLLRQLMVRDKLALLVFTHDPKVAGALGHNIRFLSDGQLRLSPSPADMSIA